MKFQVAVVLAYLISFISIQHILCDELSDTSSGTKWTCTCSSAYKGSQSFAVLAYCASSCDCSPAAKGSSGGKWACICAADRLPKVSADDHDTSCFTACNCKSGSTSEAESTKKLLSSKIVVIILLLCVILTTLVFIASIIFYVYQRNKCPIERPLFLSDKETSYNSASNLISRRATSVPEFKFYIGSPANPITRCIQKASLLFKRRTGTINGPLVYFSYSELENATNKFSDSNLIGMGGSSHVYCGHLKDGGIVAVKRMKALEGPDVQSDFLTEIELISRLHHCHVVPLLGFCLENQGKHAERLLVFEYMPNGNLREYLDGTSGKCLDWGTRVAIALGAAKGLEYLHEAAAPRILHRDVKSTNILLDENWRAKITDLGMAKRLRNDGLPSCSSSPARMQGTFGYFAPEYAVVGRASLKSDVFSFGVVLLELITGRHPIHKSDEKEESLVIWAIPRLLDSNRVILELPDPHLQGNYPEEEMQIMAYLAKECLLLDPDSRPTMSEVVQILSTIAPEKSHRRNISVNLFQSSSTRDLRNELAIEMPEKQTQDEETVNLTEPQFELFCVPNLSPPCNHYRRRRQRRRRREPIFADVDWVRPDGRGSHQCRPAFLRTGAVNSASGSAYAEFGNTKVIVSVFGPRESKKALMYSDIGRLNCNVSYKTFATSIRGQANRRQLGFTGSDCKEFSAMLHKALEGAIILDTFPKTTVDVFALVLESGGSDLPVVISCACLALADAGIMLYDLIASVSVSCLGKNIVIVPVLEEENYQDGSLMITSMPSRNEVTQLTITGEWSTPKIHEAMELCLNACSKLGKIMRSCLKEAASASQE